MIHFSIAARWGVFCFTLLLGTVSYSADIPAIRDAKDSAEQARVQGLIDGARKENALDWRGLFLEPKHSEQIIAGFKEYYGLPDLKCNYTYGMGAEIIARVTQVLEAGRTPPDIVWMVSWDWYVDLMKRGKLMRYDSPYYKECTFSQRAGLSMPGYWASDSYTNMPLWNKGALEKRGIKNFNPTSWSDFVDPRLPPLTSLGNPGSPTTNVPWGIAMRRVMGDEWFLKLAKGKAVPFDKAGQAEAWIGSGEFPICLNMRIKYAQSLEAAGVDVGWLWPKEGQVMVPFALAIFANSPHPNTAKLFVDYVRSAPGADTMAGTGAMLVYARPGVRIPEREKKYWPAGEMTVIPFDYNKELTTEAVKAFNGWAKKDRAGVLTYPLRLAGAIGFRSRQRSQGEEEPMANVMDIMGIAYLCVDTCMGIQEGQKVLIIVDRGRLDYAEALCAAAGLKGARPVITIVPEPKPYEKEPSEVVIAGMNEADVVISSFSLPVTSNQFVHTKAVKDALDRGMRWGSFTPPPPGSRGFTARDLLETRDRAYRLSERLTKADSARVTTALGTEVVMSLKGRKSTALSPICPKSKFEPGRWASMPNFSEAAVSPVEGTAEGVAIIDGMINWIGSLREPVHLSLKNGRVTDVSGGPDAERLRGILEKADENATNVAELGIGTVADQLPVGTNIDKRLMGTAHFGLGDNYTLGGSVRSNIHLDALMYGVTVELDGEPVVKAGKFLA